MFPYHRIFVLVLIPLLGALGARAQDDESTPTPPESPEAFIDVLVERLRAGDGEAILAMYHPESATGQHLSQLAQRSPFEFEAAAGMVSVMGEIVANELAPKFAIEGMETFDDRATFIVNVTSEKVPQFKLRQEVRLREHEGGWYAIDESLLTAILAGARSASPAFEEALVTGFEAYNRETSASREAQRAAHMAEVRESPAACAERFVDALRGSNYDLTQELRHPDSPERKRLDKLREADLELYALEMGSQADALELVLDALQIEVVFGEPIAPAEAVDGDDQTESTQELTRVPLTLSSSKKDDWSADAYVALKRLGDGGAAPWYVWESTFTDAVFQAAFSEGGELGKALTELMDLTERRMAAITAQREAEKRQAEEAKKKTEAEEAAKADAANEADATEEADADETTQAASPSSEAAPEDNAAAEETKRSAPAAETAE